MRRPFFTKIGRQVFFGTLLVYMLVLVTGGTEWVIRRELIQSYEVVAGGLSRFDVALNEIRHLTSQLEEKAQAMPARQSPEWVREMEALHQRLQTLYRAAEQEQPTDSRARTLLYTARDQSDRWFSAVMTTYRPSGFPRGKPLSATRDDILRPLAEMKQTHVQLMEYSQSQRQRLFILIQELSRLADRFLFVMLVVTLLFIAGITAGVPHLLGLRIRRLLMATRALEQGLYEPGTGDYPEDEFGELARAFDRMAQSLAHKQKQLQESLTALEAMNNNLEALVEQRTEELRAAHEELVRREKLAVLGTLAGALGHELRNPLSAMATSVYVLKKVAPANGEVAQHLAILAHQIASANRIITNLLDFARTREPMCEEVDLRDVVQEAIESSVIPSTVALTVGLGEEPVRAMADATQIGQVLLNLIANAVQAMPGGGHLEVAVRRKGERIEITVADTGCGMTEEQRARLFQPLFTTKPKGIGLGLAVSKKLIEAHGGEMTCESAVGKGTRFSIWLPALLPPEPVSLTGEVSFTGRKKDAQELLLVG